jgi:hypothetical protein
MAGRPPLRIGQHSKIVREHLGSGIWLARTRFRDGDGVTRRARRVGPADEFDKYGTLAEDALLMALAERRPPIGPAAISPDTLVATLIDQHIDRLAEDGRAVKTLDTYRYDAKKLAKFIGGVRVGEATPARLDGALRSMRSMHGTTMARRRRTLLRGRSQSAPTGAEALTAVQLRELVIKLRVSET